MVFGWLFGKKKDGDAAGVNEQRDLITVTRPVDAPPAKAFSVFVDKFATWWPRDSTWAQEKLETIEIEPRYGGRCFERAGGSDAIWGKVLTFDRPNHIVFTWQVRPDGSPEPEESLASRVDVRFIPGEGGKTELLLVHRDFPRHGDGWENYKSSIAKVWPKRIESYVRTVAATP